ncbi:unnamed protein product, partial [Pylaiella littoralis]
MSMIGAEARKLTPYGLAIAILERTAQKMAERAELRIGRADRLTPFAAQQFESNKHNGLCILHVLSTGNGNFTVRKAGQSHGNRVKLV